jgi:hypothetical protein
MDMIAHIRVKLLTIPTAAGGRRTAFHSGYRPHFRYLGEESGVTITTIPEDYCVKPGDTCDAMITFLRPDLQKSRLQPGSSFMIAEGRNNTAHGMITEILDATMIDPTPRKETVIFVDVDDTLIRSFGSKQIPILNAVDYVREMFNAGNVLYCWSRGGAQYSRDIATMLGIADCFVCFLPKPDVVLDDRLEDLLDHCEFIHPMNAFPAQKPTNNPMHPSGGSPDS